MSMRALDGNGDFTFGAGLNNYVTKNAEVAQNIQTRILAFIGNCFFDLAAGVNWFYLLGTKNQLGLNLAVSAVILNTTNVTGILQLQVLVSSTRLITIPYKVQTTYSKLTNVFQYDLSQPG